MCKLVNLLEFRHGLLALLTGFWLLNCTSVVHIAGEKSSNYRISEKTQGLAAGSQMSRVIEPYKTTLKAQMDEVIGTVKKDLSKGSLESTLGNWVADAVMAYAERSTGQDYDFGLCNAGGLRIPNLAAGPVTKGKIYELMPFDNYLVILELEGRILKQLFDRMASLGGWPVSGDVRFEISDSLATNITIDRQPLDLDRIYKVVLSDYLSDGGGGCDFLESITHENLNVYYRDAMIEQVVWLTSQQILVDANIEGRVKIKK